MNNSLLIMMTRKMNPYLAQRLLIYRKLGIDTIVISDSQQPEIKDSAIIYKDEDLIKDNFVNVNYVHLKTPVSWDKVFYHLSQLLSQQKLTYDYYFIMEDDVYCKDVHLFRNYFETLGSYDQDLIASEVYSRSESQTWSQWRRKYSPDKNKLLEIWGDKEPYHSMNPFCRLSRDLVLAILDFHKKHGFLYFQEIMLATICSHNNLTFVDFRVDPVLKEFFGFFGWTAKPLSKTWVDELINSNKIVHPVKFDFMIDEEEISRCGGEKTVF